MVRPVDPSQAPLGPQCAQERPLALMASALLGLHREAHPTSWPRHDLESPHVLPNPWSPEPCLQCSYSEDQKETGKQFFFW